MLTFSGPVFRGCVIDEGQMRDCSIGPFARSRRLTDWFDQLFYGFLILTNLSSGRQTPDWGQDLVPFASF
jgi:hypothetical protein